MRMRHSRLCQLCVSSVTSIHHTEAQDPGSTAPYFQVSGYRTQISHGPMRHILSLGALRSTLPCARPDDTCVVIRIRDFLSLMGVFC